MDVWTIAIVVVAAWLGLYALTVLMSQHRQELIDAWEAEHADQNRERATPTPGPAHELEGEAPAQPEPTPATPDPRGSSSGES